MKEHLEAARRVPLSAEGSSISCVWEYEDHFVIEYKSNLLESLSVSRDAFLAAAREI